MIKNMFTRTYRRKVASILFLILAFQTVHPVLSLALSSGPTQPEAQGFEPVGTTDMVDPFTGDFVYNIPLMDVEGYPINISYHGGVTMEQEASWVGLGWNINPGAVNRSVRGLPDDFNGESIEKDFYVKPDKTTKVGLGVNVEALGFGEPYLNVSAELGGYLTMSNYRGVSVDFTTQVGVNAHYGVFSGGLNLGASVGSQTGGAINYGASCGIGLNSALSNDISAGASFNLNAGGNYSPRTGHKEYKGADISVSMQERRTGAGTSFSTGTSVPIGMYNHTAALSNKAYSNSYYGQLRFGGELFSVYGHLKVFGSYTETGYRRNGGTRQGFGYFNLHKADSSGLSLLDFSREKDGMYNSTMSLLPQAALTYDVYSVSGQGTGGSFRPHRNDIGSVYDPYIENDPFDVKEFKAEGGVGDLFEAGGEYKTSHSTMSSGSWDEFSRPYGHGDTGSFESVYFKEAGELTDNNQSAIGGAGITDILTPQDMNKVAIQLPNSDKRVTRANHIYKISGETKDSVLLLDSKSLSSYETPGFASYPSITKTKILRVDTTSSELKRKPSQVTEIVQIQKDGRRYVYGLPALNNVQREACFAIGDNDADKGRYSVKYNGADHRENGRGIDEYYSSTVTPTYVAAHLLTGVLSTDYVDVTGDGITDDDLGTYTKFNYTRKSKDYRWRSPIDSEKAQYIPGYITDKRDDKASYLIGSREEWLMHSVETKNYVAEFYVSKRNDARGVGNPILGSGGQVYKDSKYLNPAVDSDRNCYKLDSIVLFNKHDRFANGANAKSIKTVIFTYDYSLCQHTPNSASGKLTLRKIQMKYGQSNINLSAGYTFNYSTINPDYDGASKDKWGTYKPNDTTFNNYEFPFTTQTSATDDYAKAWSLTEIGLPSGGVIKVDYESDDYAYVQDQLAMSMFKVTGVGSTSSYDNGSELYHSYDQPNLFLYFDRRLSSENPSVGFRDNYLNGTDLLYYNVPVQLADGKYEPIKGYAKVVDIGGCSDGVHGYIQMEPQVFDQEYDPADIVANPIVYAALNVGRYNLPQIMFPGSSPDNSDIENVLAGLKSGFGELFHIGQNPLVYYMKNLHRAKDADLRKAFVRLTSPGMKKKGGGQRVKQLRFFDNWTAMTGGQEAIYGKVYDYTIEREDKKGFISSGVASWEPISGGDELPQRKPIKYTAQEHSKFPPNDPVDLYQELPVGESFYPSPVVGYRKVTARSIHLSEGRSSQTEDINYFYTAKDFPIQTKYSGIKGGNDNAWGLQDIKIEDWATQGFSIALNDMHGKPLNTEHWVLKPDTGSKARELVSYQRNEYLTQNGQLSNTVPVFDYSAANGKMNVSSRTMGLESDITVDTRKKLEETKSQDWSVNVNGFIIGIIPIVIPVPYPWPYTSTTCFKSAAVTKIVQQYGILSKVTNFNQGAITELRNEVFDAQTGNALVTSVNNEFKDREYSVNYPAHWAYKEMGPSYENLNRTGVFSHSIVVDTFGGYASRFINYNSGYSNQYSLPSNMPVGRVIVEDDMPLYKLGDELSLKISGNTQPLNTWVMGYTSDTNNCYLVLASREPYVASGSWAVGHSLSNVEYRVIQSGNKNRLGETIQSYTTTDPKNIFPTLKDSLPNLISLTARRYNHNLNQVYAANVTTDSLNPFVTGKVGMYRPEMEVMNLKKRDYIGGTVRKMGTYPSNSYWKTEQDNFCSYCGDNIQCTSGFDQSYFCPQLLDTMRWERLGGDSARFIVKTIPGDNCLESYVILKNLNSHLNVNARFPFTNIGNNTQIAVFHDSTLLLTGGYVNNVTYENCCCRGWFEMNTPVIGETFANLFCPSCNAGAYEPVIHRVSSGTYNASVAALLSGSCLKSNSKVYRKILLGKVGHYDGTDNENWVKTQQVTKYNWFGAELENKEEGIGYNSAVYGYNQQLPSCVAKNAKHGEVLFDGFEDYALLQAKPDLRESYMKLNYSPFASVFGATNSIGSSYQQSTLAGSSLTISKDEAHTGTYSLKNSFKTTVNVPLKVSGAGVANGFTFNFDSTGKYVASIWLKPVTPVTNNVSQGYSGNVTITMDTVSSGSSGAMQTATFVAKSNLIDGWQQYEVSFNAMPNYRQYVLHLGNGYYYDDIRIFPFSSNSKAFVYHPVTRKLMATLDENNYATFYEYDAEGNLIRTKKETDQGVLTVSESRSTHFKTP